MELAHEGGFDLCGLQNRFSCFASQENIDFLDFSHIWHIWHIQALKICVCHSLTKLQNAWKEIKKELSTLAEAMDCVEDAA